MTSTKINTETYEKLLAIKQIDNYKSISAVIEDLILRVPMKHDSIKEAPAWEWTANLKGKHNPKAHISVSWDELKESEVGKTWKLNGDWESCEATILFKDEKGVFIRFGVAKYDDPEMIYFTDFYNFI